VGALAITKHSVAPPANFTDAIAVRTLVYPHTPSALTAHVSKLTQHTSYKNFVRVSTDGSVLGKHILSVSANNSSVDAWYARRVGVQYMGNCFTCGASISTVEGTIEGITEKEGVRMYVYTCVCM